LSLFVFLCLVAGFAAFASLATVFFALVIGVGHAALLASLGLGAIALAAGLSAAILALARGSATATES
jgi:hypothetical protein